MTPPQRWPWPYTFRPHFRVNSHIRSAHLKPVPAAHGCPCWRKQELQRERAPSGDRVSISLVDEEKGSPEREVAGEAEAAFGVFLYRSPSYLKTFLLHYKENGVGYCVCMWRPEKTFWSWLVDSGD